jgi:hypothetical protein
MLQLYILSKDRSEELRSAIISALNQDYKEIEIIVSDNSEETTVSKMMQTDFSGINYIKRTTLLDPLEHIKQVIEEATANFVMIFHDDDILQRTHVSNILLKFKQNPNLAAVGSNATFFGNTFLKKYSQMNTKNDVVIKSAKQLFEYYLGLEHSGISNAPFSSYIFKTSILKKANKNFYSECGKHSDLQLLAKILDYGYILWLSKLTMFYRIHSTQGSSIESIYNRKQVLNMMSSYGVDMHSKSVIYYKFMYLYRWWKSANKNMIRIPRGMKERVVAKFLVRTFLYLSISSKFFVLKILKVISFVFLKVIGKVRKILSP